LHESSVGDPEKGGEKNQGKAGDGDVLGIFGFPKLRLLDDVGTFLSSNNFEVRTV
jgi:hypothetical protein